MFTCGRPDGRLLHERFAVRVRWVDNHRLETSWTELASLDADGHRVWSRAREVHRVTLRNASPDDVASSCQLCDEGSRELCIELIEP